MNVLRTFYRLFVQFNPTEDYILIRKKTIGLKTVLNGYIIKRGKWITGKTKVCREWILGRPSTGRSSTA